MQWKSSVSHVAAANANLQRVDASEDHQATRGRGRGGHGGQFRGANRGRRRGRGGRGFGRGETQGVYDQGLTTQGENIGQTSDYSRRGSSFQRGSRGRDRDNGKGDKRTPTPRPTHFLAIPLGTHSILRGRVSSFTNALLNTTPAIGGLESKIVVDPRRIHFTLGVMSLRRDEGDDGKTVDDALDLLRSLKPEIIQILNDTPTESSGPSITKFRPLRIPLNTLDILKPTKDGGANVLWVGPDVSVLNRKGKGNDEDSVKLEEVEDVRRLVNVCDLIHKSFRDAGFITETRPLNLHCTLINTSHRKIRGKPFAYDAILASDALKSITVSREEQIDAPLTGNGIHLLAENALASEPKAEIVPQTSNNTAMLGVDPDPASLTPLPTEPTQSAKSVSLKPKPVAVNFGTWIAKEIQLCIMGSHGPENEYISVGGIRLDMPA